MPSELLDTIEKVHAQITETITSPEFIEFQKRTAEWTFGVIDAFKTHGIALIETAKSTYAQLPSEFREEVEKAHAEVFQAEWKDLPVDAHNWIKEHPYQTAFYVMNGIVFFAPAASSGPILWILGFADKGPRAASFASMLHSKFGIVGTKSGFAYLQSAGMGGYGSAVMNGVVRFGSLLGVLGGRNGTPKL